MFARVNKPVELHRCVLAMHRCVHACGCVCVRIGSLMYVRAKGWSRTCMCMCVCAPGCCGTGVCVNVGSERMGLHAYVCMCTVVCRGMGVHKCLRARGECMDKVAQVCACTGVC